LSLVRKRRFDGSSQSKARWSWPISSSNVMFVMTPSLPPAGFWQIFEAGPPERETAKAGNMAQ
jgi:hypothetical protein